MDPQRVFSLIIAGAAVLAIAGTVLVYLRGTVTEATIKQLKENFGAMKDARDIAQTRLDDTEREFEAFKAKTKAELELLKADAKSKDDQIKTLQEIVTNKAEIARLIKAIDKHHEDSMAAIGVLTDEVKAFRS